MKLFFLPSTFFTLLLLVPHISEAVAAEKNLDAAKLLALTQAPPSGSRLTLPPGTYRLCDQPGKGLLFRDWENKEIVAEGVTLILKPGQGVTLKDCRQVRLRGLTVDYDPLPFTQGTIRQIDPAAKQILVQLDPGFPQPDTLPSRDTLLYFVFDPATLVPRSLLWEGFAEFGAVPDGLWRFGRPTGANFFGELGRPVAPQEGDLIALVNRGGPAVTLENCAAIHLEGVTVHAAPSYAFFEERGEGGHRYTRCRIVRPPDTRRLLTTGADGLHSYLVERGPLIEDCEFNDTADDTIAVHGFFSLVTGRSGPATLQVVSPFGPDFQPGDVLRFYVIPYGRPAGEAKVRSVREAGAAEVKIPPAQRLETWAKEGLRTRKKNPDMQVRVVELDAPVAFPEETMVLASARRLAGNGTVVKNTVIRRSHKRGILIKADDFTVEGNTLEDVAGPSILIEPELFWLEGPLPRGVTIRSNTITRSSWRSFNEESAKFGLGGAIDIGTLFASRQVGLPQMDPYPLMENFKIEENTIRDSGAYALALGNVRGARVTGNTIDGAFRRPGAAGSRGLSQAFDAKKHDQPPAENPATSPAAIIVYGSEDVELSGNKITTRDGYRDILIGPWTRDIRGADAPKSP